MRVITILCILILLLLSPLIYSYPTNEYSNAPAQFIGGGKYFLDYINTNGHALQRGEVLTFGVFSNTIYGQTETPATSILRAVRNLIITSTTYPSWEYSLLEYFFAGLALSLSILLFCRPIDEKPIWIYLSIVAYTLFGVPYIIANIGGNAGIGWTLILLVLYTYTKRDDPRMRLLSLIFMTALPLLYYTPATMLLLIMSMLFIYNLLYHNTKKSYNITLIYFSLWAAVSIYISAGRFSNTLNILSHIPLVIKEGITQSSAGAGSSIVVPYLISTGVLNKVILLINSLFVITPVAYFTLIGFKKFDKEDRILHIIWTYFLSLVPLTFLLFGWLGFWGVYRLAEWGGVLSFLVFSATIGKICKKHARILTFFAVIAIITSITGYTIDENKPTQYLTFEEEYSSSWLIKHIQNEKSVFTDFRIAGYFVGNNHLRVTGVNNIDYPLNTSINYIEAIYYSANRTKAEKALDEIKLKNGQKMNYLIFSNQMTKKIPGIKLYDYAFKPAPSNFTRKYDSSSFTYRIYDNGASVNYQIH